MKQTTSAVLHAIRHLKPCLFAPGVVANPRDTCGYRCGLRLARANNPSVLNVPSSMQHCTSRVALQLFMLIVAFALSACSSWPQANGVLQNTATILSPDASAKTTKSQSRVIHAASKQKRIQRPVRQKSEPVNPASVRVWLYASLASQAHLMKLGADPTTGIRVWENYFRTHKLPFSRLTNAKEIDQAPTSGILLLPSTVVMSEAEKQAVLQWRNRGGAVLSTWLTAAYAESGESIGFAFMRDVLDVDVVGNTEAEIDDTFMMVHGDTPISHSLLAGTRVWLERVPHQLPLRLVGRQEGAQIMSWSRSFDAKKPAGLIAFNERLMPSGQHSRSITIGYPEQNWLRSDPKQLASVTHDIFSWLMREPQAYVGAWPHPYQGGLLLAIQAAEQVDKLEIELGYTYKKMHGLATYYVLGSNIVKAAPFIKKIKAQGHEIGYFGDQFEGFDGQPETTQSERMDKMQTQLADAGIAVSSPASFSVPMDAYDSTTQRLAAERQFGNFLAFMEVTDSSLPVVANRDASGLAQTIVLPRTLMGPEEAVAEGEPDESLDNFLAGLDLSVRMGGLSVVRIPSQTLLIPAQRQRIFEKMATMRARAWMASAHQIAQWWRDRDGVSAALEPQPKGYLLSVDVTHQAKTSEPLSIWVNLPRLNSRVRLQALKKSDKVPTVINQDAWRAAIILKTPTVGKHTWLLQFEDQLAKGKF